MQKLEDERKQDLNFWRKYKRWRMRKRSTTISVYGISHHIDRSVENQTAKLFSKPFASNIQQFVWVNFLSLYQSNEAAEKIMPSS